MLNSLKDFAVYNKICKSNIKYDEINIRNLLKINIDKKKNKPMRLANYLNTFLATLTVFLLTSAKASAKAYAGACSSATEDLNCMIENLLENSVSLPGLVSIAAYLTGLGLGVKGVLDLNKHVVAGPREMPLRTPIVEFIVSGLLLALPFTYEVLIDTAKGPGGFNVAGTNFYADVGGQKVYVLSGGAVTELGNPTAACANAGYQTMLGGILCTMWERMSNLPGLFSGFSYIAGLAMMYFAAVNLKASVEDPGQNSLWQPFQKFVVATLLLIFPYTLETAIQTLYAGVGTGMDTTDFNLHTSAGGQTLDMIVGNFVFNIYGVTQFVIKGFCYIAGMTLIIIGIFRMMKTMQEGPRGPGGIGTIMTFITGSALLAIGPTMAAFATTLFGDDTAETKVDLTVPGGGLVDYEERLENFISAVLAYMLILGWVSFVRGLFLFRAVAEGDQQASMMSAVTHLLGGAILVNLGPFLTAVSKTLGPIAGLPTVAFS